MTQEKLDTSKLKRSKTSDDNGDKPFIPQPVSAGAVDKVIDLAFNPSKEKIREVTIIDRVQGRLFPQVDMINYMRHYCLEIAMYRQSPKEYKRLFQQDKPVPPEPLDEFVYRTAQWQKSVAGKNLERATDIALAETEARGGEGDDFGATDAWKE